MSIKIKNLEHIYSPNTPYTRIALDNISLDIKDNSFNGVIGHTGSGKSTLLQHLNGILKPSSGSIYIDDLDITDKSVSLLDIRKEIGLVFQYPEYQLFEDTVFKDIAFGPKNLGLSEEEICSRVEESMKLVGLDFEKFKDQSPFDLSGGEKRRVAIAGIIAMKPKILILDEPTAGLDPLSHEEILNMIDEIHKKTQNITILVSHNMDDICRLCENIIVLNKGRLVLEGNREEVFEKKEIIREIGLDFPQAMQFAEELNQGGFSIKTPIFDMETLSKEIVKNLKERRV